MTTRRDILDLARAEGWTVEPTRGGHLRLSHPRSPEFLITSSTPGDGRALANIRAQMKRLVARNPKPEAQPRKAKPHPRPALASAPPSQVHGIAREVGNRRIEGQAGEVQVTLRLEDDSHDGRFWRLSLTGHMAP